MKKIISTVALVLVCSLSINAQDKKQVSKEEGLALTNQVAIKSNPQQDAKMQAYEIVKYLGLKEELIEQFYTIINMKQEVFSNINYSPERRSVFMESFNEKLKGLLGEKSFEKLVANKDLYTKVIATPELEKR